MRTDHNTLAALITATNAGQFERRGGLARAWWPTVGCIAARVVSAYMVLAALALVADYFDLIGP